VLFCTCGFDQQARLCLGNCCWQKRFHRNVTAHLRTLPSISLRSAKRDQPEAATVHAFSSRAMAFVSPLPRSFYAGRMGAPIVATPASTSSVHVLSPRRKCRRGAVAPAVRTTMVFTGIVEEMGTVTAIENLNSADGGVTLEVSAQATVPGVALGDSISVNGTCLTVTHLTDKGFNFGLAPETLRRTNLGALVVGSSVNLERSLAANGRFGGHVVQGHVDATGKILSVTHDKEAKVFEVGVDESLMKYVVEKGYVTVDGASLTVCEVMPSSFTFMMIAYTQANVVTASKVAGDIVNIEVDITGKYIEKIMAAHMPTASSSPTV
jgi:riboflavin synthase